MARFDELGKAIGIAISKDESGVRNLLKRNGVNTSSIKTKSQLSDVFIESLVKSKGLAKDFMDYVKSKDTANYGGSYNSFGGDNANNFGLQGSQGGDFSARDWGSYFDTETPVGDLASANVNKADDTSSDASSGGFFSGLKLVDIINLGSAIITQQNETKISNNETEQIKIASQTQLNNDYNPADSGKSNTGLYIGIAVVGVALLGTAIYFVIKKK